MRSVPWQLTCPVRTVAASGRNTPEMSSTTASPAGSGMRLSAVKVFSSTAAQALPFSTRVRCSMPQSASEVTSSSWSTICTATHSA